MATASHSIAASYGYPDGERIPLDLMIDTIGRVVAAVDLPVNADLESGYGDAPTPCAGPSAWERSARTSRIVY